MVNLLIAIITLVHPIGNARFIKVTGTIVREKLTISRTDSVINLERIDADFRMEGETLVVDLHANKGMVIGGAGALLGLPPRPITLNIQTSTSKLLIDLSGLPLKTLKIRAKASFITIVDDTGTADTIQITAALTNLKYIGAGLRKSNRVIFSFSSSIVKLLFSDELWNAPEIVSTLSSIEIYGALPEVRKNGILNMIRGTRVKNSNFYLNLTGSFNLVKLRRNF